MLQWLEEREWMDIQGFGELLGHCNALSSQRKGQKAAGRDLEGDKGGKGREGSLMLVLGHLLAHGLQRQLQGFCIAEFHLDFECDNVQALRCKVPCLLF